MSNVKNIRVIIVGGGISGLSAGKLLSEHGVDVIVLEAQDRVGGRTHTLRDESFGYTDVGGAYVGPTQRRVARMARELGLTFYKVNEDQKTILSMKGYFMKYKGTIPNFSNPVHALDMNHMQRLLQSMAETVPVEAPWKATHAEEWDSMTYQQFIDKHCWTQLCASGAALICRAVLCAEPCEVSLLFLLWYVRSGQGVQRLTTVTNGAQERKFVGGAGQLSERLADHLGDARVRLGQPVIKVTHSNQGVTVTTATGDTYQGDYMISAVPQTLLGRITFSPSLPPLKRQLIQRMPMGSIIKTMMFYSKAFWRDKGLCGQMATDKGPVLYCVDDTKPDGSHPCIMGFILANQARELAGLTPDQRKKVVADHYADVFRCEEFRKPVNYGEKNWMDEEYSGGCYVAVMPPGVLTKYAKMLRCPLSPGSRVLFAGTEAAVEWAGYMEGAIEAGERAARQLLCDVGELPESSIWQPEPPVDYWPEQPVYQHPLEPLLPSVGSFFAACAVSIVAIAVAIVHTYIL